MREWTGAADVKTPGAPRIVGAGDADSLAAAVALGAKAIRDGELVSVPTETVYGLACALTDEAVERLLRAKGRPPEKGITVLVDSIDQAESLGALGETGRRLAERFWPGPLTLVVPALPDAGLPMLLTGPGFTVGLRLPNHPVPRALARAVGPLPLTSANRSGQPEARDAGAVVEALGEAVALVLDAGPVNGVPSTVVSVEESGIRLLRAGSVSADELESASR